MAAYRVGCNAEILVVPDPIEGVPGFTASQSCDELDDSAPLLEFDAGLVGGGAWT